MSHRHLSEFIEESLPRLRPAIGQRYLQRREHLGERCLNAGSLVLAENELLELVLSSDNLKQNMLPLANRLIATFGDFNRVISASALHLAKQADVTEEIVRELKIIEAAAHQFARTRVMDRDVLSNWDALIDYCRTSMAHLGTEQLRILFLDSKSVLFADEVQSKGTVDHVTIYPREVICRALELEASAFILVHNHPSGDPTPSRADIEITRRIGVAAEAIGIELRDHIIVGKGREVSFRNHGLLETD